VQGLRLDILYNRGITLTAMRDLQSLGPIKFYGTLLPLLDKHSWRKCSNILSYTRRIMTPRGFVDPENARRSADEYAKQAIVDCHMPEPIKAALKVGMAREFSFTFSA